MMREFIRKLRTDQARIRTLWSIMPFRDAVSLVFAEKLPGNVRIFLRPLGRHVVIRRLTTDLACLQKVFVGNEYQCPFQLAPELIVDAGANIGMATLFFAHHYPNARIIAIEPESSNFTMLQTNCEGIKNITLIKSALWSNACRLRIADSDAAAWAFSVTDQLPVDDRSEPVMATTIPEILDRMNAIQIDLLKLDIEGAELELFSVGSEKWLNRVCNIVIELHDRYVPGCAKAFYSALSSRNFVQELRGENIFVKLT